MCNIYITNCKYTSGNAVFLSRWSVANSRSPEKLFATKGISFLKLFGNGDTVGTG
jgi:hypothetical protein